MEILSDLEIYARRTSGAYNRLDERHFDHWNHAGMAALAVMGGCLDAPDTLPAGSMRGYGAGRDCWTRPSLVERGELPLTPTQLAEREALAERLIAEILAEENA